MTRFPVLLGVCLLALTCLPAVALSQAGPHPVDAAAAARFLVPMQAQAAIPSVASARLRAGVGASIHGSIISEYGFAMPSTRIYWSAPGGDPGTGSMLADGDTGAYSFTAVPAAAGNGELMAVPEPDTGNWQRGRYGMTWADGDDLTVDLRAGTVGVGLYRGGPWSAWKNAVVLVWTKPTDGNGTCFTMVNAKSSNVTGAGWSSQEGVEAGTGDGAAVYFWSNEGEEVPFTDEVGSGSSTPTLEASEESASRTRFLEPMWSSGRPGKAVILSLTGFDIGWVNQIRGQSDYPAGGPWKNITRVVMKESEANLKVTIPSTAKPGYFYWVAVDHMNGMAALRLMVPYQVASLKPSSTSVARGGSVRLSGVVPVDSHWGAKRGTPKTVTLYKGPNSQPQPRTWEPSRYDYAKVGTYRTDGYGRFHTPAVRVNGTTTFIVRYPGDATYWRAYTTPVLVKVK